MTSTPDASPSPGNPPSGAHTQEAIDALSEWVALIKGGHQQAMRDYGLPMPYAQALSKIDGPVSMKELGSRLGCDPSFVTAIADVLEEKGLARRETDLADRRVKNLSLTPRGEQARAVLQRDFYGNFPGLRKLSPVESREFLALLRKMVDAENAAAAGSP